MKRRASGILLHITSLPSKFGVGDLGPSAYEFVDFLDRAGQSFWQVLPLAPTDSYRGNSPYSSLSAFAGNPLLISPELLVNDGLLEAKEVDSRRRLKGASDGRILGEGARHKRSNSQRRSMSSADDTCDYEGAYRLKNELFDTAFRRFKGDASLRGEFDRFVEKNTSWLDDYALFVVIKRLNEGKEWTEWNEALKERDASALKAIQAEHAALVERERFLQFVFYRQWGALKRYCNEKGIRLIGDIPIYVSFDSADAWSNGGIFKLGEDKKPLFVSGVPPDYFSRTGQLWGNPVYNWDVLRERRFDWWVERMRHNLELFDIVRIDHFRGLIAYWEVEAHEKTAVNGRWVPVPYDDFFSVLKESFPGLPFIAEDLGVITDDVRDAMCRYDIPGMRVLLFAFGEDNPKHPYLPHNYIPSCVVYTGTHDNNTVRGWFERESDAEERKRFFDYIGRRVGPEEAPEEMMRLLMMSVADTVIVPMQDVLGLGEEARMNKPATGDGNWLWRLGAGALSKKVEERLFGMTRVYGRAEAGGEEGS